MTANMKVIINDNIHGEGELVKCFEEALKFPVPAENFDDLNELLMHPNWLDDETLEIEVVHESVPDLSDEDLFRYFCLLMECLGNGEDRLPGDPKSLKASFSYDYKPFFKKRVPQIYQMMKKAQMSMKADWRQIVLIIPMSLIFMFALVRCIMLIEEVATTWAYICAAGIAVVTILAEFYLERLFIKFTPVPDNISISSNYRTE